MSKPKSFRKKTLSIASTVLMMASISGTSHALVAADFEQFKKNLAAVEAIKQSDQVGAMLEVNRAQTARTPADIGERRIASMTERLAAEQAVETTKNIVDSIEAVTFGKGLSPTMACKAVKEKETHTVKQELSAQVRTAISQSNAATHFSKDGDRRAMRAKQHYEKYCDITEVAQGACLASGNTKGGMDTDYSNIHSNLTLTDEQIDAGYGYMHNIIDPAKSDYSFCDTLACEAVGQTEQQYHALGSMVQNAFLNQLQDGIAYDTPPGGAKPITVEQKGALSEPWDGRLARWGETTYVGGGGGGAPLDLSNLPSDMKALREVLIDLVSKAESAAGADGWNASNNGTYGRTIACSKPRGGVFPLTTMTLGQMKRVYRASGKNTPTSKNDCSRLFAAGKYQIIYGTFLSAQRSLGLPDSAVFNEQTQKAMAGYLVDRRIGKFMSSNSQSLRDAKLRLAQEWASLGVPDNPGKSYYGGANSAKASVTREVWAVLEKMQQVKSGGQ